MIDLVTRDRERISREKKNYEVQEVKTQIEVRNLEKDLHCSCSSTLESVSQMNQNSNIDVTIVT